MIHSILGAVSAVKFCVQQTVIHGGWVNPSSVWQEQWERAKATAARVFPVSQDCSDIPIPSPPYFPLKFVQIPGHNQGPLDVQVILYQDTFSGAGLNCFWRVKIDKIISTAALGRNWGSGSVWHWGGHNKILDNNHCPCLGTAIKWLQMSMRGTKWKKTEICQLKRRSVEKASLNFFSKMQFKGFISEGIKR